ncbi:hypothetical protein LLS1_34390 [Leifsonia sp. LS1]|uniref:hypothetical protein n=1 Tax=Leifsonia sp. LS1 TaxID=2828483 RepID=UPI001CFF431C|nr:hypothetical protein [Leifsonia sp. LS1]GIT81770.1 hypothetical protein LLS1_34390 [Leifsonia sp. LS1]
MLTETDTALKEPVTVVLEARVPVRLDWNGERYYVDAPPEPRGRVVVTPEGRRPDPAQVTGWRIVASSPRGESHVFDVRSCGAARWWLTGLDDLHEQHRVAAAAGRR